MHQFIPSLLLDQSDLPATALIGIAGDPAPGHEMRRVYSIHRAAPESLDPDGLESPFNYFGMTGRQADHLMIDLASVCGKAIR
jgi:hypothetical protein